MSKSDEDYILMVLRQKSADDCVLREVRPGVWSCTEFKSGKNGGRYRETENQHLFFVRLCGAQGGKRWKTLAT